MALILPGINSYEVTGVYTGALTSSPGLAAALESAREHSSQLAENYDSLSERKKQELLKAIDSLEKTKVKNTGSLTEEQKKQFIKNAEAGIGIGHSVGYPFGVLIVILAVNFLPVIFKIDVKKEREIFSREINETRMSTPLNRKKDTVSFDITAFIVANLRGYSRNFSGFLPGDNRIKIWFLCLYSFIRYRNLFGYYFFSGRSDCDNHRLSGREVYI
jgi:putative transport protein